MEFKNYNRIKEEILLFQELHKRKISLIAVSKKQSIEKIHGLINYGHLDFGENYVQEGVDKIKSISNPSIIWHFIGPIQSNKTKLITEYFNWVHSVDRLKIYDRIKNEANSLGKKINFLIQINISKENTKSGININDIDAILDGIDPNDDFVCFRGIMAIPSNTTNINLLKTEFSLLNKAFISLKERFHTVDTLSMGMSNDYLLAMNHGSTMIRVGSKIFGERI
ncbi:MAG: YggS family pyridoxal phosphate-dependent enzyme [Betaproteobacteria bacterium]|nr:YggS family pyridoxal phosphate-dependent enzyme [Betaproteobacteria bacterium]